MSQNASKEAAAESKFRALQDRIYSSFGASEPAPPVLRCRNATQTSVVLEWEPIELATASLISLSLFRNGQKAGNIPRPLQMHSTKISGLAVDTEYTFHLVLRTTAGTLYSERVAVRTHKMTDLSGITITTGILPPNTKESVTQAVERIGAKLVDGVRIDTTHFVTTEGRGQAWEKAVEGNIPVVRPEWVVACEKGGRILGVTKFYLDAMRPGPPIDEQPPPPVPKDTFSPNPVSNGSQAEDNGEAPATQQDGDSARPSGSKDDSSEEDSEAETEPKAPIQDEQKVRLEDKETQKVAFHPGPPGETGGPSAAAEEEDDDDDDDEGSEVNEKAEEAGLGIRRAPTGDGASFQDVQL